MRLAERFWATVTYVMSYLTFSPLSYDGVAQHPLQSSPHSHLNEPAVFVPDHPRFRPPGGRPGDEFTCDYKAMTDWIPCSSPANRGCWLRHPNGSEFNIRTDYENLAPIGIDRYYTLDVTDSWLNPDGLNTTQAKLFNNTYPGPWIQACWGDVSAITSSHKFNSDTSMHANSTGRQSTSTLPTT